jgi:outer membrane protein with glycine zipper/YXWGXW repeat-containing protein
MNQQKSILFSLGLTVLCAGCVGTGPNTQQGAVAGGALGALAGAIIGNNSGGHNALGGALIGGAVGAIAGGTIGNSIDQQRGTIYTSQGQATTNVVVAQPPPPPPPPGPEIMSPQPSPYAVWVPGYYAFDGQQYGWIAGRWEVPPPQYHYFVRAHWAYRGGNYVYIRGYWR